MNRDIVLLLSKRKLTSLISALAKASFQVVLCGGIADVLRALRHEREALLLVDAEHSDVDVLEVLLNVRDIDQTVPILVIGDAQIPRECDQLMQSLQRVVFVSKTAVPDQILSELTKIVEAKPEQVHSC